MLLRKGIYPHEYMDDWEKFQETTLLEKKDFYSSLNLEDITDADYMKAKRVCKNFKIKNLGEYYDLYLKTDIILFANVFENFRKIYLNVYQLDSVKFISAPDLAWQVALKNRGFELDSLKDIDMLLVVEKVLEVEYATQSIVMQKPIITVRMIAIRIKNHGTLITGMLIICMAFQWCKNSLHLILNGLRIFCNLTKFS